MFGHELYVLVCPVEFLTSTVYSGLNRAKYIFSRRVKR